MTVYYCGPLGNDANSGLNWANRKLTLNGCENVPVVAGDTVYVAPGVYRETLTVDVSGGAGSPITYIGDVSGEHTDGVGGVVRITGSDNDQTVTRASCIVGTVRNYRTFRGFAFDTCSSHLISFSTTGATNCIIEDCTFDNTSNAAIASISCQGANQAAWIIRRCFIMGGTSASYGVYFSNGADVSNPNHIVEDCTILGGTPIYFNNIGNSTVRNCSLMLGSRGVQSAADPAAGQVINVINCIIVGFYAASFASATLGFVVENYNDVYGCAARSNVAVGANSNTYPPLFDLGIFHAGASQVSGFRFPPPLFGTLSQWSQVRAIADTGAATEDILGLTRPVTAGKRSWGAIQYVDMARDTATVRTGTASKKLADAGRDQIYVPTTAVSTVFSVYVYREANYAGMNPSMIIKQPGQADTVVTDAGAAGAWNQLTTTLTPAALPGYVVVELVSNNTAAAGNYATYFDDLTVT